MMNRGTFHVTPQHLKLIMLPTPLPPKKLQKHEKLHVLRYVTQYVIAHVIFCHESTWGESEVFILRSNCLMYSDGRIIWSVYICIFWGLQKSNLNGSAGISSRLGWANTVHLISHLNRLNWFFEVLKICVCYTDLITVHPAVASKKMKIQHTPLK